MPVDPERELKAALDARAEYTAKLTAAGLTRERYMAKLDECLEATKPISCIKGKDADGGTVDFIDVPDYRVQLDAVKMIISLYGDNAPVKQEVDLKQPIRVLINTFEGDND